jgi:hypothetical protein
MTEKTVFEANAARIVELHEALHLAFRDRDMSSHHWALWEEAGLRFRKSYDGLAFPGGLIRQQDRLKRLDPEAVELAVQFLEANPWFFRSGYIKEGFIRVLKRIPLSEDQQSRLRRALLAMVDQGAGREFRQYCTLARAVRTTDFRADLEARLESTDQRVSQRARWMLEALT